MAIVALFLALSAGSGSVAVLGAASEGTEPPPSSALARALGRQGLPVISGSSLRELVLGGARQRAAGVSPDAEALVLNLEHDYDDGELAEVAQRAQDGASVLAREPPSERREALVRELELLWGAALLATRGRAAAVAHFERIVILNPAALADPYRFSPPVQELLEHTRAQLLQRRKMTLEVSGALGGTLFVDGLPRGPLPAKVALWPHRATVWVESLGKPSLAHEVDVSVDAKLAIDGPLETAVRDLGAEVALVLPATAAGRQEVMHRLAAVADVSDLVVEERGPSGILSATRFNAEGAWQARTSIPQARAGVEIDWREVTRELMAASIVAPTSAPPASPPTAVPALALATPVEQTIAPKPFPWLPAGLVAGGVIAAAVVSVAIVASLPGSNAILVGPKQANP